MNVTFGGKTVTLEGEQVKVGSTAPDFTALGTDLKPVKLSDFGKKVKLISVFPSIDTEICSIQNHRFNNEASSFGDKVAFIAISNDLPFALKRFCGAEKITNLTTLSDHKDVDFGKKYGFLIKELRLLTRRVIILDKDNKVQYVEIVPEIASEPNYTEAIARLKQLV